MTKTSVLDHGEVELIDYMGNDHRILQSARVSTGGVAQKGDKEDRGLIRYLYKNQHLSPFEQVQMTWRVKCPIFVARQWFRHRAFSYNEYSGRYSPMVDDMYMPDAWRSQGTKNHQGSGACLDGDTEEVVTRMATTSFNFSRMTYRNLIEAGVTREQARAVLPVANYTEFYFTGDLRNILHFLELRLHSHAQYEIRVFAEAMLGILESLDDLKWSVEIFKEMNEVNYLLWDAVSKYGSLDRLTAHLKAFLLEGE